MNKFLSVSMLGILALCARQVQAAEDCEQIRKELDDNKRNVLKEIKLKKKLKNCLKAAESAAQGGGVTTQPIQIAPVPAATQTPSTQYTPTPAMPQARPFRSAPSAPTQPKFITQACGAEFESAMAAYANLPPVPGFDSKSLYSKTFSIVHKAFSVAQRDTYTLPYPPPPAPPRSSRPSVVDPHLCMSWEARKLAEKNIGREVMNADINHVPPNWMPDGVPYWRKRQSVDGHNYLVRLYGFSLCALRHVCNVSGVKDVSKLAWDTGRPPPSEPPPQVAPPPPIRAGGPDGFARGNNDAQEAARRREREQQDRENKKWYEEAVRRERARREEIERQRADEWARRWQGGGTTTPPRPVARPDMYGALAINYAQGRAYGWAVNARTQDAADQQALSHCNSTTSGQCTVVMQFRNTCASYAVDYANNGSTAYGWAWGPNQANVDATALNYCRQRGGPSSQCTTRVWGCTSH